MKKCKYCHEEIQDEAIKCRFCGEYLTEKAKRNHNQDLKQEKKESRGGLVTFLIVLSIIALIAILFGV